MKNEKIEKLKAILGEHSSLVGARQEYVIFPKFILEKTKELKDVLFREFEISGKRNVLSIAVLFMLEAMNESEEKNKTKTNGK